MTMEICGSEEMLAASEIHSHCSSCIKIWKCALRPKPGEVCEIVSCEAQCGARFHACKLSEHKLLCANEKVPCINAVNGCPIWLLRRFLGRHLETCPASVVHCTMEWNRWPVCSRERQLHIPFHQPNPNARAGQLDVALALRDQRMLNEWLRAPRRTRRALRNSLTRRFPAVPLQLRGASHHHGAVGVESANDGSENSSSLPSRAVTDDEEDTPWEARKAPPGLQRSVCSELYRASKQTTESLTAALNMITNHNGHRPLVVAESRDGDRRPMRWIDYVDDKENLNGVANGWSADEPVEDMDIEKLASGACGLVVELPRTGTSSPASGSNGENMDIGGDVELADDAFESPGSYDVLFVDHTVVSEISAASMTDHARKQPAAVPSVPPPPPPTSPPLFVNLGLDLTLESITRYQTKPKSMYTFLCAQEFRRDEYSWHYKNVHSDIHGGLNGWLEQRCPLAHYGCMYSMRRFFPTSCGSSIVHNDILESFGVKPFIARPLPSTYLSPPTSARSSPERRVGHRLPSRPTDPKSAGAATAAHPMEVIHEDGRVALPSIREDALASHRRGREDGALACLTLTQLPFEVLQHVARFLDSFSICNLAMTSRLFREVCCSLLEERGIVVQQWEKVKYGKRPSWRIAYKRWFFSTAFTPIHEWGFEEHENMANHLKSCIYFQRNHKTEPYFYPVGINPNPHVLSKLKEGICEALRNETTGGDSMTKL